MSSNSKTPSKAPSKASSKTQAHKGAKFTDDSRKTSKDLIEKGDKSNRKSQMEKLCADEIIIPPKLPGILKVYTKAAIRTQPPNLLLWSIQYFRAMEKGEAPPVKERYEERKD